MSISNLTCIATQPHFYIDNSLAYVAGKCLLKPLVDLICDESNLESQLNYLCKPGSHTFNSPVVGSRAKERMAISLKAKEEPILGVFENALKENIYLIPDECREIADKIADLEFSKYIDKYRYWGLNEENVFHWTSGDYFRDRVVIFDPKNRWDTWRVEAMAVSSNSRFAAINLIMQVEEITRGVSLWRAREFDNRLLPTLATVMHVDEAIKECKKDEYYIEVKGVLHSIGKVANCYRLLEAKFGSLVDAVVSVESITFIKTGVCDGHHP